MHNVTLHFEGEEDRGVDVVARITMRVGEPGIYWFEIFLGDAFVTRVPLRVIYRTVVTRS